MGGHNNWPYIINLGNSIIGVAVLAMPFCFKQCGILLSMLVLLFCTWLTLASCQLLMKAGITSRRRSYEFLAYHTHGATGKLVSEVGMIGMQLGTLIAQIVVIGDLGPAIISKVLGIENSSGLRTFLIVLLCLGIGLPLGLLKNLRAVSRASTICISFYCVFVLYVLYLSLPNLWTGAWYPSVNFWRPQGLFQCLPILSFSFGCQTQLFLVYDALPEPSLKAINGVISSAVNLCAVAYLLVGFFGYIAFYSQDIPGDVIAIFPSTLVSEMMKLCFVFSIVITFPVIIFPCRASIYTLLFARKAKPHDDVMESEGYIPENLFKLITILIVLGSMITGILIPNVEFILGMNGAITGTLICYIFPALFFMRVMGSKPDGRTVAQLVLFLGITILLVSTYATLSSQDNHQPRSDLTAVTPALDRPDDLMNIRDGQIEKPAGLGLDQDLGLKGGDDVKKKIDTNEVEGDTRKEPPIPDPPDSNGDNVKEGLDEGKDIIDKRKDDRDKELKKDGEQEDKGPDKNEHADADKVKGDDTLKVEQKAIEEEVKEKEKEKKQEQFLAKLEKQQKEQEKLLQEQKEVLKELKDHHEKDKQKAQLEDGEKQRQADQVVGAPQLLPVQLSNNNGGNVPQQQQQQPRGVDDPIAAAAKLQPHQQPDIQGQQQNIIPAGNNNSQQKAMVADLPAGLSNQQQQQGVLPPQPQQPGDHLLGQQQQLQQQLQQQQQQKRQLKVALLGAMVRACMSHPARVQPVLCRVMERCARDSDRAVRERALFLHTLLKVTAQRKMAEHAGEGLDL
ncbi:putative sodium-coupled neutral amino acid transporter 10 isoform X2 [Aplysia californica]|nr:putative sodium-coupled neutral amino acid transporter 10 isoform X2 [Aplysia californica]